ncbi:hypothetical protein ACTXGQ_16000 [Marinobacter sp. 1Y8]
MIRPRHLVTGFPRQDSQTAHESAADTENMDMHRIPELMFRHCSVPKKADQYSNTLTWPDAKHPLPPAIRKEASCIRRAASSNYPVMKYALDSRIIRAM